MRCRGIVSRTMRKPASGGGFTLVEVVVALLVGTVIVGGVMGLISASLRYNQRINEKAEDRPILEAAAQDILVNPDKALSKSIVPAGLKGGPQVEVRAMEVSDPDIGVVESRLGTLYRVELLYRASRLEFSVIIPESTDFD